MSRIYYHGKFFDYPLKAGNALRNLGVLEAATCVGSYVWAQIRPPKDQTTSRAGSPPASAGGSSGSSSRPTPRRCGACRHPEMPADWAAQRIKNLVAVQGHRQRARRRSARARRRSPRLIDEFQYPKLGPGHDVGALRDKVAEHGGDGRASDARVTPCTERERRRRLRSPWPPTTRDGTERPSAVPADDVISSMPISALVRAMDPPAPAEVVEAADDLRYRDFLTVALVVPEERRLPGQLDLHPRPRACGSAGSRTSSPGRRTWSRKAAPASAWSTSSSRATTCGPCPTTTWSRSAPRELERSAWSSAGVGRGGLRGADAQGLPGLRRRLPGQRRRDPRLAGRAHVRTCTRPAATACTSTTTRTTR